MSSLVRSGKTSFDWRGKSVSKESGEIDEVVNQKEVVVLTPAITDTDDVSSLVVITLV